MAQVEIYTKFGCPHCARAMALLREKGVSFQEYDINSQAGKREEMMKRAHGRHTVPQIFVGDHHIGGCDDLVGLERSGRLDPLLGG